MYIDELEEVRSALPLRDPERDPVHDPGREPNLDPGVEEGTMAGSIRIPVDSSSRHRSSASA